MYYTISMDRIMANIDYTYCTDTYPFDPFAGGYFNHNALKLAACANLAYEQDPSIIHDTVKQWGYDRCKFIDDTVTTQLFVAANAFNIVISFRGTDTFDIKGDWLQTILRTSLVDDPHLPTGRVHEGLMHGVNNVWDQLLITIEEYRDNNQPIWVTGHSLGGGLSVLAGTWLQYKYQHNNIVKGIYTFGQPRIGDPEFTKHFTKLIPQAFRFVNNNDLIPRLPHNKPYEHIGEMVYFTQKGQMTNTLGAKDRIIDRLKGAMNDLGDLYTLGFNDHSMNNYIALIRRNLHIQLDFILQSGELDKNTL